MTDEVSRTDEAIAAFVAALTVEAAKSGSVLPAPKQNEALPARLVTVGTTENWLNVWDGDGDVQGETLGADEVTDGYDLEHRVKVEWVAVGGTFAARRAAFDKGLLQIHAATKRGPLGGYLGDRTRAGDATRFVVDQAAIESVARSGGRGLVTDGLPNIKAADVTVLLKFTSDRPF